MAPSDPSASLATKGWYLSIKASVLRSTWALQTWCCTPTSSATVFCAIGIVSDQLIGSHTRGERLNPLLEGLGIFRLQRIHGHVQPPDRTDPHPHPSGPPF